MASTVRYVHLGSFTLTSKTMYASDALIPPNILTMKIKKCKPGTWHAVTKYNTDDRVVSLYVFHSSIFGEARRGRYGVRTFNNLMRDLEFKQIKNSWGVGVDTGTAGFFDADFFSKNIKIKDKKIKWSDLVNNAVDSGYKAGVLPNGAASKSGYGDGSYNVSISKNSRGTVNAAYIVYS